MSTTTTNTSYSTRSHTRADHAWAGLRILIGLVFLWAFFDKLLGLGFATASQNAWIRGGSPTFGYLNFGTSGPLSGIFQAMAGSAFVDWLFMMGLLGIGISLVLGVATRFGAYAGIAMMALLWLSAMPPANNPVIDEHVVYAAALWGVAVTRHTQSLSLDRVWTRQRFVQAHPSLQ